MSDPRPLAIIDLDGVVADARHRLHHLETRPKDWDAFFAAAVDDDAHPEGVAIVDGAPLNSGILATGPIPTALYDYAQASEEMIEKTRRIKALTDKHGTTLIRAALAFPLGHPAVTAIIPGFSNPAEFADNLAGYRKAIPAALWSDLKAEGLLHPEAPSPATPVLS